MAAPMPLLAPVTMAVRPRQRCIPGDAWVFMEWVLVGRGGVPRDFMLAGSFAHSVACGDNPDIAPNHFAKKMKNGLSIIRCDRLARRATASERRGSGQ